MDDRVKTPCIGVCSTGIGDSVCRGCKRYAHEVIQWNGYSESEKRIIEQRLASFLAQIVESRMRVCNKGLLLRQLDALQIAYCADKNPSIWAYQLLRAGASQVGELHHYGIELASECQNMDLAALKTAIDHDYYQLSEAHYQRYFQLSGMVSTQQQTQQQASQPIQQAAVRAEIAAVKADHTEAAGV